MADTDRGFALRTMALATCRVTTFVIAVVVYLHLTRHLEQRLGLLSTESGAAAFLTLWALTWYLTRVSLRRMTEPIENASPMDIVCTAAVAGCWNGVGFYAAVIVVTIVSWVAKGIVGLWGVGFLFFALVVFGGPIAFTVGAVVGALSGLFETLFIRVGSTLFDRIVSPPHDDAALSKASTSA